MLFWVLRAFIDVVIEVGLLLPFIWLAKAYSKKDRGLLWIAAALLLLDTICIGYFSMHPLAGALHGNWSGKLASIIWAVIFIYFNSIVSKKEVGWTARMQPHSRSFFRAVLILLSVIRLFFYLLWEKHNESWHLETILYQATLPGIAEELIFRGILLSLANKVFPSKYSLFHTSFGWGAILTSLLFALVHGCYIDNSWSIHFITLSIVRISIDGFFLALVKERSRSLIPAIIIHNVLNVIGNH